MSEINYQHRGQWWHIDHTGPSAICLPVPQPINTRGPSLGLGARAMRSVLSARPIGCVHAAELCSFLRAAAEAGNLLELHSRLVMLDLEHGHFDAALILDELRELSPAGWLFIGFAPMPGLPRADAALVLWCYAWRLAVMPTTLRSEPAWHFDEVS